MLNNIRNWWQKHQTNRQKVDELQKELRLVLGDFEQTREFYEEERAAAIAGITCVEAVLDRGVDYFDSEKLPYAEQVTYVNKAKEVLQNETLQNEIRHMEADWVTFAAKEAHDFATVRDMRVAINALELLLSRLASIPDPRREMNDEEPFAPV